MRVRALLQIGFWLDLPNSGKRARFTLNGYMVYTPGYARRSTTKQGPVCRVASFVPGAAYERAGEGSDGRCERRADTGCPPRQRRRGLQGYSVRTTSSRGVALA